MESPSVCQPREKDELVQNYAVSSIPMLIFLNEKGEVVTKEGHNLVASSQGNVWGGLKYGCSIFVSLAAHRM